MNFPAIKINALFIIFIAGGFSCSKSSSSNTSTCTATTGDTGPLTANKAVSYSATVQNGATISSISYQDSAGTTTVKNLPLPFSKTVNLKSGMTVSISASGNSNSGEIKVSSNGNYPNSASCP
jgi:hypothetical protein